MLCDHSAHIFYFYDINNAIKRTSRTTKCVRSVKNSSRPSRNSFEFGAISWNWNHKYRNLLLSSHRRVLCKAIGNMFEYRLRYSLGSHSSLIKSTNIFSPGTSPNTYRQYNSGTFVWHNKVAFWPSSAVTFLGVVSTFCPLTSKRSIKINRERERNENSLDKNSFHLSVRRFLISIFPLFFSLIFSFLIFHRKWFRFIHIH